jgi:hypothetical protein
VTSDYRALALELHELTGRAAAHNRGATTAYSLATSAAEGEVRGAEELLRRAGEALDAEQQRAEAVDRRSAGLWRELGTLLRREIGPLPEPYPSDLPADGVDPLERASERIGRAALGEPVAPVPGWTIPLLPPLGALVTLAVSLPVRGLLALGANHVFVLDLLAEVALFVAPFAGVPALMAWTRRRFGARPDYGAMGLTALGGMIAACGLVVLFR